ncbi:MAG: hypothetical protein HQ591_01275 [candidate division Zixibacteria bacterium]|nr:hypothetical protein [Candidatus Tariuqbacter arcticus]
MKTDAKTIYAQSSDIKSRTYLEYRKDMKQKAIAELEVLPWLRKIIKRSEPDAEVDKFGGDKFLWFLRKGGITREPDFIISAPNVEDRYIEFQYAKEELGAYDFKISKIAPRDRKLKKRMPKANTEILYIIKPKYEYTLIRPEWIINNSTQTVASAWGNAPVFRVSKDKMNALMRGDKDLVYVCKAIDMKINILDFQHEMISIECDKLSHLLQSVIDENKIVKVIPKTLDGFFKVCFILSRIDKTPENANLWLIYLLSYLNIELNLYNLFQLSYCLDFLYPLIDMKDNEAKLFVDGIKRIKEQIIICFNPDGSFQSDKKHPPLDETRCALSCINIIEDLIQDFLTYYEYKTSLKPIRSIFQTIPDIDKTHRFISS